MTRCIKRVFCLCAALVFTARGAAADETGGEVDRVFYYAEALKQGGALKEAAREYQRYLFLQNFQSGSRAFEACRALFDYYKNADAKIALGFLRRAQNIFIAECGDPQNAYTSAQLESLAIEEIKLIFKTNAELRQNARSSGADLQLENENALRLFSFLTQELYPDRVRRFAGLCALRERLSDNEFDAFLQTFDSVLSDFPDIFSKDELEQIQRTLDLCKSFKAKNPKFAAALSIIPGAGQLYAGRPAEALNAFLLNGSIIAASIYSLATFHFFEFTNLEFPLLFRFYRGNLYNAQKYAYEYNAASLEALKAPAVNALNQALKKESPQTARN